MIVHRHVQREVESHAQASAACTMEALDRRAYVQQYLSVTEEQYADIHICPTCFGEDWDLYGSSSVRTLLRAAWP